jgi:hypothetical protein
MTDPVTTGDPTPARTTMTCAYDAGAHHQRTAIDLVLPLFLRALDECAMPRRGDSFVFVDYGSATGFNSFVPVHHAVSTVRRRSGPETPLCVVHNDQPDNDFSTLFRQIIASPGTYGREPLVFAFAVGRSFFGPVVPPGFASIGWSANAVHWLSAPPHPVEGDLWFRRPADSVDTAFGRRARGDWVTFLEHRARELRPGGQLVVTMVEADENGAAGADHFLDRLRDVVRERLASGALRPQEVARMHVPLYYRSEREIRAPFESPDLAARFVLAEYQHGTLPDPLWAAFEQSGDAEAFARAHVAWQRAFSEHALFSVLDGDRSPEKGRALADEIYEELRQRVADAPEGACCTWRLALLRMIRK